MKTIRISSLAKVFNGMPRNIANLLYDIIGKFATRSKLAAVFDHDKSQHRDEMPK